MPNGFEGACGLFWTLSQEYLWHIPHICQSPFLACFNGNNATQENQRIGVSRMFENWNAEKDRLWDARS
jgi:hypothetical protein